VIRDVLEHSVIGAPANSVADALLRLVAVQDDFEQEYRVRRRARKPTHLVISAGWNYAFAWQFHL
jgi:hypothetical protein